ncbi:MAG: pyridoxamine 5'-phosphate oxidase family protein [Rhodospirillales bacterium]
MTSLDDALAEAWELLNAGATDRHSPFHLAKVATVTADGRPSQRTVVLRHVDPAARTLRFHTDRRSGKVADLAANPAAAVLFYDAARQVQLRIDGTAGLHKDDAIARDAWNASRPQSRACYLSDDGPGTPVDAPPPAPRYDEAGDDIAFGSFCAVVVGITRLEWMHLAAGGHRRARFDWSGDDGMTATWLSP